VIIVDRAMLARQAAGKTIRVGIAGAGFMGRAVARQLVNWVPGMEVAVIANRHLDGAVAAYEQAGVVDVDRVESTEELDDAIRRGRPAVTEDLLQVCRAEGVDAVLEATGTIEMGARVVMEAIEHGRPAVLVNAELDGTVGPILHAHAERAGVVYTNVDGDQPAAELNLYRFVRSIGATPLLCGNIKGLIDHYRTPETQTGFAAQWGIQPYMATSFADGTKISFEQAVVANATGMGVAQRDMRGLRYEGHVDDPEHLEMYDVDELRELGGIVDYVLGATPGPGVFVLAAYDDPAQQHLLDFYKMGKGPLYCLYTPYHLCHLEVPLTVARALLFEDAAAAPTHGLVVDVVATAKRDLRAGEMLDGFGQYTTYGQLENADVAAAERLLPIGIGEGCTLARDVAKDDVLTYDDVSLPPDRLCDRLRAEQMRLVVDGVGRRAGAAATEL
jgi:predicted homoserine dehydrogenase-like protein